MGFGERRDAPVAQDVARPGVVGGECEIEPAETVKLLAQVTAPGVHVGLRIERREFFKSGLTQGDRQKLRGGL